MQKDSQSLTQPWLFLGGNIRQEFFEQVFGRQLRNDGRVGGQDISPGSDHGIGLDDDDDDDDLSVLGQRAPEPLRTQERQDSASTGLEERLASVSVSKRMESLFKIHASHVIDLPEASSRMVAGMFAFHREIDVTRLKIETKEAGGKSYVQVKGEYPDALFQPLAYHFECLEDSVVPPDVIRRGFAVSLGPLLKSLQVPSSTSEKAQFQFEFPLCEKVVPNQFLAFDTLAPALVPWRFITIGTATQKLSACLFLLTATVTGREGIV